MGVPLNRPVELSRGLLDRMTRDQAVVAEFPGFSRFVRTVTYARGGCGCGGRKAKKSRVFKKKMVDHAALKRHILGLPPQRQAKLKQLIGVRALRVLTPRPDRKMQAQII